MLTLDEIKALTSILVEGYNNGFYIPFSKLLRFNKTNTFSYSLSVLFIFSFSVVSSISSINNSEIQNSLNSNEDKENMNDKTENLNDTDLLNSLDEETDSYYNIIKILNTFNFYLDLN